MATSTRTVFQSTLSTLAAATTSRGGEERSSAVVSSAATRALALNNERLERDQATLAEQQRAAGDVAVADGAGLFRRLGGTSGYRPRGITTSGGHPTGSIAPASEGRIGGMPAGSLGDGEGMRLLEERAAEIDATAGAAIVSANPNDLDGEGTQQEPRRPGDLAINRVTGVLYYWDSVEEQWLGEIEQLEVAIASPAVQQYPAIGSSAYQRRVEGLAITNRNTDGTPATAGTGALLVNGSAVTLGTTLLPQGGYLALNVTNAGTGILIASITLRAV